MRSARSSVFRAHVFLVQSVIDAQGPRRGLVFGYQRVEERLENLAVHQIGDAHAAARDLVFIAGADATRGGANGNASGPRFAQLLHQTVRGQQNLRPIADEQVAFHAQARGFQHFDLFD